MCIVATLIVYFVYVSFYYLIYYTVNQIRVWLYVTVRAIRKF